MQSDLSRLIGRGLAKAATIVGMEEMHYRPSSPDHPTDGIPFGRVVCAYDVRPRFQFLEAAQINHAFAYLLADPTAVLTGDYLVGDEMHFIARVEPLKAALCVLCNETIDYLNAEVATVAGTNGYGGRIAASEIAVAAGWPVSMSARTRGGTDPTKLPSDTRSVFYDVLAPAIPDITLTFGMRIRDSAGQDYEIVSAEQSSFGWKLVAGLATT